MKTFKTPKGTELPLRDMKGKDYLDVQYRVLWMREEHPEWGIQTEYLQLNEKVAIAKATIRDGSGNILAQGTKTETPAGFGDFVEKAETGSVGRALALCGYGTQFAQELEEGERIVDSPREPKRHPANLQAVPNQASALANVPQDALGGYVIRLGKKLFGKRLDEIDGYELDGFSKYLQGQKRDALGNETLAAVEAYLNTREVKGAK